MSYYFLIKFISRRMFFQSISLEPDNTSHVKTGLQGCKYSRNSFIYLIPEVPILQEGDETGAGTGNIKSRYGAKRVIFYFFFSPGRRYRGNGLFSIIFSPGPRPGHVKSG